MILRISQNLPNLIPTNASSPLLRKLIFAYLLAQFVLLVSFPTKAFSTLIYDYVYTGNQFNVGDLTRYNQTNNFLSIEISSPFQLLPSNSNQWNNAGLSYSMNAGGIILGSDTCNSSAFPQMRLFISSTDASGLPTSWDIMLWTPGNSNSDFLDGVQMWSRNTTENSAQDFFYDYVPIAASLSSPGAWSLNIRDVSPVPEPSTIFLLGIGMASLVRRKIRKFFP